MNDMTPTQDGPNAPQVSPGSAIPPEELDRMTDDIIASLKTAESDDAALSKAEQEFG